MKATTMILTLVLVIAACGGTDDTTDAGSTTTTVVVPTDDGLELGSDENGLVARLSWLEGGHPALGPDVPADTPRVSILDGSTSDLLLVGYLGGGCPSEITVNVTGNADNASLEVEIGPYIVAEGLDCIDLLMMHGFQVETTEPIDLDSLVVSAS